MAVLNIDRLTLKLMGGTERDGQRLAALISEGLATAMSERPHVHIDSLKVDVPASSGESVDAMARQVVAEILRQLDRAL